MKLKTLKKMHKYINKYMFDDLLDTPNFVIIDPEQTLYAFGIDGYCENAGDGNFMIGITKFLTTPMAFDTMVHEMIHQYLMEFKNYSGHGKKFKKQCRKGVDIFYPNGV